MVVMARAALCVCVWLLSVCAVRGFDVPPDINTTIQNLLRTHYKSGEVLNGKPLIPRVLPNATLEEKMVFMGGVLETYEKLLNKMLGGHSASASAPGAASAGRLSPEVQKQLKYLLKRVRLLRENHYHQQEQLLTALRSLTQIQTGDLQVQRKALWELNWQYEEAASLVDERMVRQRRRKRRHAWQRKSRPRI